MGLVIYSLLTKYKDKTPYHNLALATFSWIMLNICSLASELSNHHLIKDTALIFIALGCVSIVDIIFIDRNFLDKFKSMSKKKNNKEFEEEMNQMMDGLSTIMRGGYGIFNNIFNAVIKDPRDNNVYELGHGLSLVVDQTIESNTSRYSHLFKDGMRISDTYFRLGGLSYGFEKKPYAQLIVYKDYPNETWGDHCIIDATGKIVLTQQKSFESLYYWKGVIASMGGTYYNLQTGLPIVKGSTTIKSERFLFIENNYGTDYAHGVWKIEYETGNFEIFN